MAKAITRARSEAAATASRRCYASEASPSLSFPVAIALVLLALPHLLVAAEDSGGDNQAEVADNGNGVTVGDENDGGDNDWMAAVFVSLAFAFVLSSIGTLVGFVSVIDDLILRRYETVGSLVDADVVSAEFLRGGTKSTGSCLELSESEYSVTVEYDQFIADDTYKIRIRKQLKAKESDFIFDNLDASESGFPSSVGAKAACGKKKINIDPEALVQTQCNQPKDANGENALSKLKNSSARMKVLVMPEYPKSGLLKCHVGRSTSLRYRLALFAFVTCIFLLAIFCVGMAANSLSTHQIKSNSNTTLFVTVSVVTLAEIPVCYHFFHQLIKDSLKEEYFNDGELVPTGDDSTFTSLSDAYLNDSGYRNLSTLSTMKSMKSENSGANEP